MREPLNAAIDIIKRQREIFGDYMMPQEETRWILDHNRGRYREGLPGLLGDFRPPENPGSSIDFAVE